MVMVVQDAAVAAVAVAGAAVIVTRLVRGMRKRDSDAACPSCASGESTCAKPETPSASKPRSNA
jgi:hypothetical protein